MGRLTLDQKERFLRKRKRIPGLIRKALKEEDATIFGARSVNIQVRPHLRSSTEDFDIFVKGDPEKSARRIERKLDKKFKGNFFKVEAGKTEGVYKVKSRLSGKGLVDVQKQKEQVNVVKRKGNKFATLDFQKKKIKESLANPEAKFRSDKDKFSRLRIQLHESKRRIKKINKRTIKTRKKKIFKKLNNSVFNNLDF